VNFAPDIDINNNPNNPAINTRSFGEDKEKVAKYGIALTRGMRDAGVAGSAIHFPGHGDTDVDSHLGLPLLPFTYERLDTLEMYPFK
ncbi:MAG: glycosyl hydrolase family 3, partial [Bacteroidales bacterium]|nr:glycosyl hydrolase family 3 [Bacteroidales bacterium]